MFNWVVVDVAVVVDDDDDLPTVLGVVDGVVFIDTGRNCCSCNGDGWILSLTTAVPVRAKFGGPDIVVKDEHDGTTRRTVNTTAPTEHQPNRIIVDNTIVVVVVVVVLPFCGLLSLARSLAPSLALALRCRLIVESINLL